MVLVSVWITTYNHESFIAEALEGALMQKTNFDFEIIIGEDCSTDNTRQIVKEYKAKYPEIIKLYLPEKNLGMIPMSKATYSLCTGRYIAWLDGDDIWTDPFKLQKQIDFLESNQDYVLCFHKVNYLEQVNNRIYEGAAPFGGTEDTLLIDHFIKIRPNNPIDALSVVHRNILGVQLPEWFYTLPFLDLGLYFLLLQFGKMKYMNEVMGTYRSHSGGAWSGKSQYQQYTQFVTFYQRLLPNLNYLNQNKFYREKLNTKICLFCFELLEMNLKAGNYDEAKKNLSIIQKNKHAIIMNRKKRVLKLLLQYLSSFSGFKWLKIKMY